jgi:hypothetical protein
VSKYQLVLIITLGPPNISEEEEEDQLDYQHAMMLVRDHRRMMLNVIQYRMRRVYLPNAHIEFISEQAEPWRIFLDIEEGLDEWEDELAANHPAQDGGYIANGLENSSQLQRFAQGQNSSGTDFNSRRQSNSGTGFNSQQNHSGHGSKSRFKGFGFDNSTGGYNASGQATSSIEAWQTAFGQNPVLLSGVCQRGGAVPPPP